jgi:hypothetical protein
MMNLRDKMSWNDDMPEICVYCEGSGIDIDNDSDDLEDCPYCEGLGYT